MIIGKSAVGPLFLQGQPHRQPVHHRLIGLAVGGGGVISLDTENADVRETVISGYPAITIHKEGVSVAACTLEDLNAILLVTGQGFSVDDVVRVAESVRLR